MAVFATAVGALPAGAADLPAADGTLDASFGSHIGSGTFADPNHNFVTSTALDGDGNLLVGGRFGGLNGIASPKVARLSPQGVVDQSFGANVNSGGMNGQPGQVRPLADGGVIVTGQLQQWGSTPVDYLARLNHDGTFDSGFSSAQLRSGRPFNNVTYSVAQQSDGAIIVGGSFTKAGVASGGLARLSPTGAPDTVYASNIGAGPTGMSFPSVDDIAVLPDGSALVGGRFTAFSGVPAGAFAKVSAQGQIDSTFATRLGSGFDGEVTVVRPLSNGKIAVGGDFTTFNGSPAPHFAILDSDGTLDAATMSTVGAGFNGTVETIAELPDGSLLVGGDATSYDGITSGRLAHLSPAGVLDHTFSANAGTNFNDTVASVTVQSINDIYVGGFFSNYGKSAAPRLAEITGNTVEFPKLPTAVGTVGKHMSLAIAATNAKGYPLTYTATGLPQGLTIDPSGGTISGVPATAGTAQVSITATDPNGESATAPLDWVANEPTTAPSPDRTQPPTHNPRAKSGLLADTGSEFSPAPVVAAVALLAAGVLLGFTHRKHIGKA
ncbi:putative Ig domain-containing protein [Leifsonia sp. NPDC102414]|uniref:putative Ig domain-containing protein n=1 Tax=Leifsonia sp. NPDC102414 TaxID=3364124 RepID=UPI0037FA5EAE